MDRRDTPTTLASVLTQSPALRDRQRLAWATWRSIVGHRVASHTMPLRIDGDTLHVAVSSALWASELSLLQTPILAKLRTVLPRVHLLRFRVGPVNPPLDVTPPVRVKQAELPAELSATLAHFEDSGLGDVIREAAAYSLGRAQGAAPTTQAAAKAAGQALFQKPRQ